VVGTICATPFVRTPHTRYIVVVVSLALPQRQLLWPLSRAFTETLARVLSSRRLRPRAPTLVAQLPFIITLSILD
jgi:hypothetical protein